MLLFWLPLFGAGKCGHLRFSSPDGPNPSFLNQPQRDSSRLPIRVRFNLRSIVDRDDANTCYEGDAGKKSVYFRSEFPMVCTSEVEMTPVKQNTLLKTLANLENYVGRFLTVERLETPVTANYSNVGPGGEEWNQPNKTLEYTEDGVDLHILVVARFGDQLEGIYAASDTTDYTNTGRPIAGYLIVNPKYIPDAAESETDWDHEYFSVLLHELMHALAWSYKLYPAWQGGRAHIPKEIKNPLNNKTAGVELDPILVIDTPEIQSELYRRFGTTTFPDGSEFGLQLDDRADPRGEETHFKTTYYLSDLMNPYGDTFGQMSNLTLCGLYDSGWYDVDFQYAEPVFYANGPAIGKKPYSKFPVSVVSTTLPKEDLCYSEDELGCFADPRISPEQLCVDIEPAPNCSEQETEYQDYCSNKSDVAYNPNGVPIRNQIAIDFANVRIPVALCPPEHFCASGSTAKCCRMECGDESATTLIIYDGDTQTKCAGGESVIVGNSTVVCPNPTVICGLLKKHRNESLPAWAIGVIAGCSGLAAVGASVAGVKSAKKCRRNRDELDSTALSQNSLNAFT